MRVKVGRKSGGAILDKIQTHAMNEFLESTSRSLADLLA